MNNHTRPQQTRLRRILEMIREGMRRGALANCSAFMQELEVSRRTALYDLDRLRDDERAPVEYDASLKGYYLTDPEWSMPPISLSRSEVFAFVVASRTVEAFRGTPLEEDVRGVMEKIAQSLEGRVTLAEGAMTGHLSLAGSDYVRQDPAVWSGVAALLDRSEVMLADYRRFDGRRGNYRLEPLHLYAYKGNWYLLARKEGEVEPAMFALSRFSEVQGCGRHFHRPEDFDPAGHLDRAFGIMSGGKAFSVRLRFRPKVAAYIRERVWHPDQVIRERRDGSLDLQFTTAGWKELVRWVLSWQPDVEVLSPKKLRERVRVKMRQALAKG